MYHACVIETSDEPSVLLDTIVCMIRNNMHPQEAMQRVSSEVNSQLTSTVLILFVRPSFAVYSRAQGRHRTGAEMLRQSARCRTVAPVRRGNARAVAAGHVHTDGDVGRRPGPSGIDTERFAGRGVQNCRWCGRPSGCVQCGLDGFGIAIIVRHVCVCAFRSIVST